MVGGRVAHGRMSFGRLANIFEPVRNTRFPLSWQGLTRRWTGLTLAGQFLLAASTVVLAGMLVIGFWVSRQIEEGVITNSAATTALYVDSVIAPLFPKLGNDVTLSEGVRRALDETLSQAPLGKRLAFFKIWARDGVVAYSSEPGLIGKRFEITENLKQAWAGKVTGEFDELSDEENATERTAGLPLLEIYSPIREPWSGRVVAVAEFYEVATDLKDSLLRAQLKSWLIVALVTICMMALLFGIVGKGSSLIQTQRAALEQKISDLSALLRQNEVLRLRVEGASRRAAALNERYMRKISADLHDGPAQLLALASLRLDSVGRDTAVSKSAELSSIRSHLDEAMEEIRSICRGLVLPQLEEKTLTELLREVVGAHEQRTGTMVELETPEASPKLDHSQKICVYRFVQEGLNNAFRHANAAGQRVFAIVEGGRLQVTVSDRGPGLSSADPQTIGLGLAGLRERIESLGGEFHLESSASGTRLTMLLKIEQP